ncbi:hypothetical protein HMP0721_1271 [Pseudoramibacter alactolyticus ATCC 23263]|uniref:Uncharacterized protein n=1 Tax=Pseudoramibacter alactolyticus ATCC 23263 TaxID=887929 RepID=E6MGY7_9FIRM|nr:DUF2335 domain-containing protein [Pseudoramibacter alactolyticus]EFV01877.1 hypothetical protein HMP0721_1271 [Pseudoramibacter alactolyticus ATCC 23263]
MSTEDNRSQLPPESANQLSTNEDISEQSAIVTTTYVRMGPLPALEELEAYDRVVPGSAERIIAMAEEQSKHRRAKEMIKAKAE